MTATRKFNWSVPTKPAEDAGERSTLFSLGSPAEIAALVAKGEAAGLLRKPYVHPNRAKALPMPSPPRAKPGEATAQVRDIWVRTQRGESARLVAIACNVSIASVRRIVQEIRRGERRLPRPEATAPARRH